MNKTTLAALLAVALLAGGAGYWLAPCHGATPAVANPGRQVLYWYDPMVPGQHFEQPGKSPFMDMQLVPKYADEGGDAAGVRVDAGVRQNLGIRLAPVTQAPLASSVSLSAELQFNTREQAVLQARGDGFVSRVAPLAVGDVVAAGSVIAELQLPAWTGAQQEYLALRAVDATLAAGARQRLLLLGMDEALIRRVERAGTPQATVAITTPRGGVIEELGVRPGMTVSSGMLLARIVGNGSVWLEGALPEAQAAQVRVGDRVDVSLAAYPGEVLQARVDALLPQAAADSRTLRLRVTLPNRDGRLRPGMSARLAITPRHAAPQMTIPAEALIRTGQRQLVIVSEGGRFLPQQVEAGAETDGRVAIVKGLTAGQQVVASGQFLIDSEASLQGVLARLAGGTAQAAPAAALHRGSGRIEALAADGVTLSHGPVASLGWGEMTMRFALADASLAAGFKVGDTVRFTFSRDEQGVTVRELSRDGAAPAPDPHAGHQMGARP